jgi:hypothetical protein
MAIEVGRWDLLLIVVVSLQTTAMAYLRAPRWKAFILSLPFPFTIVTLAVGRPVSASHVLGLVALFVYGLCIWLLHRRLGVPIVAAIGASLFLYAGLGWAGAQVLPASGPAFWLACGLIFAVGLGLYLGMPACEEPGHRTALPVWLKLPVIAAVVLLLVTIKGALQGFASLFPMVGVVGAYESRHSLWTFTRQMPVLMLTLIPLMASSRLTQEYLGLGGSLLVGWAVFLSVLIPFTRYQWASTPE